MGLTMNYQGLQFLYAKTKNKKNDRQKLKKKKYPKINEPLTYQQQLEHPYWINKRKAILSRDRNKCLICGSNINVQVHHTKYGKGKYAWEYPNSSFVTLCKDCHNKVHSNKKHPLYPKYI